MEKQDNDLCALREACESSVGSTDPKERILFSTQLLYKAGVVNRLGFTNCDIKLENILFKLDSKYKEAYIVDYGHLQQGKPCQGGTETYQAPETIYKKLDNLSPKWTKFMTPSVQQADAFAMGMVLLLLEVNNDRATDLIDNYSKISQNLTYDVVLGDKTFLEKVREYLEEKTNLIYKHTKNDEQKPLEFHLEILYHKIIANLLNLN
jgi:serine/threonine protein kinase